MAPLPALHRLVVTRPRSTCNHRQRRSSPTPVFMSSFLVGMGKHTGTSSECNRLCF